MKFEVHKFSSRARIIDIWKGDHFHLIQFTEEGVGFSDIGVESDFSILPNIGFNDFTSFKFFVEKKLCS